jgi:hypothetical protein
MPAGPLPAPGRLRDSVCAVDPYPRSVAGPAAYERSRAHVVGICEGSGEARVLRHQVLAVIRQVLDFDAYSWVLTDPETSVGSEPLADVPSALLPQLPRLIGLKYLTQVNRWTTLGRPRT